MREGIPIVRTWPGNREVIAYAVNVFQAEFICSALMQLGIPQTTFTYEGPTALEHVFRVLLDDREGGGDA